MESNNSIDNQFREKLNGREIKPSENAWDRLDAMLTVADSGNSEQAKQKPKRNFGWMYIAASFLGFILIATVFLSQTEELVDVEKGSIVNETVTKSSENESEKTEIITPKIEKIIAKAENKSNKNQKTSSNQNSIINQTVVYHQDQIAENPPVINEDPEINQRSNYANVDELLAAVKKDKKDRLFQNGSTVKVNSVDLLSQVDGELELSFRQKIIKSVSKNYQEVKVALSTRNQE